jgi:hypothetical protein
MTDIEDPATAPPPVQELGRQLEAERVRPRPRRPLGYRKNEIPTNICSSKTLGRLESGSYRGVKVGTVLELLRFYETPHQRVDHIARLAEAARAGDWCSVYSNAVNDRGWFLQQCEDAASYLCYHSALAIPSLIHSEAYYRMIADTTKVFLRWDVDIEEGLEFRMERRERWIASERPAMLLIGEAALTMGLGPARETILEDVQRVAALPFVEVRIMPLALGRYDLQPWSLNLFEYDGAQPPVINVESPRGGGFVDAATAQGRFFTEAFKIASASSITSEDFFT